MIADLLGTDTTESPAAQGHESRAIRRIGAVAAGLATAVRREPDLAVLAFVVLTLPLELSKQWFPIQILEISRVGMIVGIGILVLRAIRGRLDPVPRGLVWGTVLLIAVSGASVLLTWWPHGIRIEAAIIVYAAFALFVAQTARDRRRMTIVGWILIISGVFIAVVLLVE